MLDLTKVNEKYNPFMILGDENVGSRRYMQIAWFMDKIKSGDYQYIGLVGNGEKPNSVDFLQYFYEALPIYDRYWATLDVYVSNGYNFPKNLIFDLMKIRPTDYLRELPLENFDNDEITIYRASTTYIHDEFGKTDLLDELSWTTSIDVASWFFERYERSGCNAYLYQGKIKKQDIIAYSNSRNEFEVIQFRGVNDIELLESC